jgi:hypothetical protein
MEDSKPTSEHREMNTNLDKPMSKFKYIYCSSNLAQNKIT